jgi:hypothetical protein
VIVSVTVAVWLIDPLVPVMLTVKVPRESALVPWNVSVEVVDPPADTVTGLELKVSVTPATGSAERDTVPANPFKLVTVMVTDPDPVRCIVRLVGEALMLKSGAAGGFTVKP